MTVKPTGHYQLRGDGLYIEFDRLFHAPIEDVWYSLTNRTAMKAWIGTYTGSPATGAVRFRMNAEEGYAEDEGWEAVSILFCDPPHHFVVDGGGGAGQRMRLLSNLTERGGMTALSFGQRIYPDTDVASIGPGWDYYLDRLTAARTGAPMPDWSAYHPAFTSYYRDLPVPHPPRATDADDAPDVAGDEASGVSPVAEAEGAASVGNA
ncbi:SRPBCC domain-containing protein [Agromyces sp. Marseille-Q5079]|uniref:SRPBCC domain-containing protein n=1 Tax=Agromyces sp. Marseille-Q5079 TaxID=3439059 RepID=UPI003D9C9A4C